MHNKSGPFSDLLYRIKLREDSRIINHSRAYEFVTVVQISVQLMLFEQSLLNIAFHYCFRVYSQGCLSKVFYSFR